MALSGGRRLARKEPAKEPEPEGSCDEPPQTEGGASDENEAADCVLVDSSDAPKGGAPEPCAASEPEARAGPQPRRASARWQRAQGLLRRLAHASTEPGELLVDDGPRREAAGGADVPAGDGIKRSASDWDVAPANAWQIVECDGTVIGEELADIKCDPFAKRSVEAKIEQLLTWMLAPAIHGIPKLGVPGAIDRADELLAQHDRDVEAAVREVVAGSERTVPLIVLSFCLECIPIVGCPTVLLRSTWGNLRSILIVAALYGHDLGAARVQHEALLCLVPPGADADAPQKPASMWHGGAFAGSGALAREGLVSQAAQWVAKTMIKGALQRATGLKAAVDCFELASRLYTSCGQDATDEDGFVHMMATPASAARDLFKRQSLASCALLWCSLPLLTLGMAAPTVFAIAQWLPGLLATAHAMMQQLPRCLRESAPALFLSLLGMGISIRTFWRLSGAERGGHRHGRRHWLVARVADRREVRYLQEAWPQLVTALVFSVHALLPAASTYAAVSMILNAISPQVLGSMDGWRMLHRVANMFLGMYGLLSAVTFQLQGGTHDGQEPDRPVLARALRLLHIGIAAARGCCVLVAWTYGSIAMDIFCSALQDRLRSPAVEVAGAPRPATLLGVVGPLAWLLSADSEANPLRSQEALAFVLNVISVASQQRLVELLGRREVLMRLIGAEKMTASTLCLLMKGVAVACKPAMSVRTIGEFLTSVAPPPLVCVLIVMAREEAILVGAAATLGPCIVRSGILGSALSFALGAFAGVYLAHSFLLLWYTNRQDLESPALRLAFLVPGGVSARAKGLLRGALVGARSARAVQMMAMGLIQRLARWIHSKRKRL